jgi:hypothetical protein
MDTATGMMLQEYVDTTGSANMELASRPTTRPQSAKPNLEEWATLYGGRARIPWLEWDRALEAWKAEQRAEFERRKTLERMQAASLQADSKTDA